MQFKTCFIWAVVLALTSVGSEGSLAQERSPQHIKLAVLRITYDSFTEEEMERVSNVLYDSLSRDDRVTIMTQSEVREKLVPLGIVPSEINSEQGYIGAGRLLEVDYLLVGTMDKIGNFVEVTFRTFKMPSGTLKRYPGGKTLDILLKEEIPKIVKAIYLDLGLAPKVGKKTPWAWIALGGVAAGAATFFIISSGGEGSENGGQATVNALPRPPNIP